ncbi:MAG: hypothetical protein H6660_06470 [Ardenticatenaceae bacterium]|nr:hypothetical protein [Ardenticatenaceae bacterium]
MNGGIQCTVGAFIQDQDGRFQQDGRFLCDHDLYFGEDGRFSVGEHSFSCPPCCAAD